MASTKDVLDHHLKCFGVRDLKGILSDYAPDAVLFTSDGPLKGADAIRPLFQAMIADFEKPGAAFNLKQESVDGDYGYILWAAETADNFYEVGLDTFVMRDGKIVAQSFTGKVTPRNCNHTFIPEGGTTSRTSQPARRQLIRGRYGDAIAATVAHTADRAAGVIGNKEVLEEAVRLVPLCVDCAMRQRKLIQ